MTAPEVAAFAVGQQVTVVRSVVDAQEDPAILAFVAERIGQTGVVEDVASPEEHEYWILVRFETPDIDGDYRLSFAAGELEPA